jgi:hypothetical protein
VKIFRTPPAYDPIVRAEWHGNKYDVPRSWTQSNRQRLFAALPPGIRFLIFFLVGYVIANLIKIIIGGF